MGECNAHIPRWLGLHLDRLEFRLRLTHSLHYGEREPIALWGNSTRSDQRFLHNDEVRALQVLHKPRLATISALWARLRALKGG
jgi:hypothetical protein